jgi:hypothetical protein
VEAIDEGVTATVAARVPLSYTKTLEGADQLVPTAVTEQEIEVGMFPDQDESW